MARKVDGPAERGGENGRRARGLWVSEGFVGPLGLVTIGMMPGRCGGRVRGRDG